LNEGIGDSRGERDAVEAVEEQVALSVGDADEQRGKSLSSA
jgi:hypothetical protein